MLALEGITHRYRDGSTVSLPSWQGRSGEHWAIVGPSGSGKSTFLPILAGLLRPASGRVVVGDQELHTMGERALDRFRGRHIGLVFQSLHLIGALTVADNLRLARYFAELPRDDARIRAVLGRLDINELADQYPHRLSQGQAQRVAIARALVNEPLAILADEPTSALDDRNCRQVMALLTEQARDSGAGLVVATHDGRVREYMEHTLELPAGTTEAHHA